MAQILGSSLKAVQSFEQGWRKIPVHVERQMLFLLAMKKGVGKTALRRNSMQAISAGSLTARFAVVNRRTPGIRTGILPGGFDDDGVPL